MKNHTATQPTSEQVAAQAYSIWEKEGRSKGRELAHWLQADKQLKADVARRNGVLRRSQFVAQAESTVVAQPRPTQRNLSKRTAAVAR